MKEIEVRIKELENNTRDLKYNIQALDSSVKDIKLILHDSNKSQTDLLNKLIDSTLNIKTNNNKNSWTFATKILAGIGILGNIVFTYYFTH